MRAVGRGSIDSGKSTRMLSKIEPKPTSIVPQRTFAGFGAGTCKSVPALYNGKKHLVIWEGYCSNPFCRSIKCSLGTKLTASMHTTDY